MGLVGETVRDIRILELLGEGGMGQVYLGFDERLKRNVALKVMTSRRRLDETARRRFQREAEILSQLDHPNICRVFDLIPGEDSDLIVLELVEGRTLREAWEEGLSFTDKLELAIQVAEVLVAAHRMSVVHRDLKPENVMVTPEGVVKVLDFGLARSLSGAEELAAGETSMLDEASSADCSDGVTPGLTEMGHIIGTPRYMSPEQAFGKAVTAASDMYAFGLLLQELFTEKPLLPQDLPFEQLLNKVRWGDIEPVQGVDAQLTRLINEFKELEPQRRPSAVAAAERLRHIASRPRRRRRRMVVSAVWTALALLGIALGVQSVRATRAAAAAELEAATSRRVSDFMVGIFEVSDPWTEGDGAITAREILERGARKLDFELADEPRVKARMMTAIGRTYSRLGMYDEARSMLDSALEIHRGLEEEESLELAETLRMRGGLAHSEAELDLAEPLMLESLEMAERLAGSESSEVADYLTAMAEFQSIARNDYEAAEAMHRRALGIREKIEGPRSLAVAESLTRLGNLLADIGEFERAEPLLLEALEISEEQLGEDHLGLAEPLYMLARFSSRLSRHAQAEELWRRVLEIREKALGSEHPDVFHALDGLAAVLAEQEYHDEAVAILLRVLELRRGLYGEAHPAVANTLHNLGAGMLRLGRYSEAEDYVRQSLAVREEIFGPEHHMVASTLNTLATIMNRLDRSEEAAQYLERGLLIDEAVYGYDHWSVGNHLVQLAVMYEGIGELETAEDYYLRTLEQRRVSLGPDHPWVAMVHKGMARLYNIMGRYEDTETTCAEGIRILEKVIAEQPDDLSSHRNLGQLNLYLGFAREAVGDHAGAIVAWERVAAVFEPIADRYTDIFALDVHARALVMLGRFDEARPIVERLVAEERASENLLDFCRERGLEVEPEV